MQDELSGTENRIAVERRKYNETVQKYNTDIELFPKNIAASHVRVPARGRVLQSGRGGEGSAEGEVLRFPAFTGRVIILALSLGMSETFIAMPSPTFHNYIDGQWVAGQTFENRNPADTSDLVGEFVSGSAQDMADAVDAASRALPAWSAMPAPARGALLYRVADGLERKFDQLGEEMTREEGKTLPEAKGEVRRAINIFRYFAGEGSRMPGPVVASERDRVHMWAQRKPVGVVGLVTPWNFPIAIPAWKMAPALICGNTIVVKPASVSPLSAWRIVEACREAGIPKGVVNFVAGSGSTLGKALINAPALKAVSFTGSCGVGEWLHAEASKRRLRIQLEMGGKNPTIVLADANFEAAVENTVNAAFFSTGQKCTATSRVIVEDAIYDRFLAALVERTKKLKVGNGLEAGIDIGPAVDQGAARYGPEIHRDRAQGSGRASVRRASADGRRLRQGIFH